LSNVSVVVHLTSIILGAFRGWSASTIREVNDFGGAGEGQESQERKEFAEHCCEEKFLG
jgi:hypothetical protein